jgi:hypothetical protein
MMISRSFLFLGAISLYSVNASVSAAGGGGLRRALKEEKEHGLICQLGTLHTSYMGDDNQITQEEETTCTLVEDGVPTPFAYPIALPNEFFEQHGSKQQIDQGRLLVSFRGASLVAGEYVLNDDSEITVLDHDFSPSTAGRKLIESKDPRDATGQRRLIAFRVNGVAGERQVRLSYCYCLSVCLSVSLGAWRPLQRLLTVFFSSLRAGRKLSPGTSPCIVR